MIADQETGKTFTTEDTKEHRGRSGDRVIARNRKGKSLPRINADERGSDIDRVIARDRVIAVIGKVKPQLKDEP